jgi:GTP-binding protein HflX
MKALLVVADYFDIDYDLNESIEELKKLTVACHMQVENIVVQHIHKKTPQYYIGKGKVEEIALMIDDVDIVIFNEELTPLQMKNLSDIFLKEVSDRSDLILRIFETRAKTKEAKLQVKIARSEYMLPRIAGMRKDIYSQQGGMGFRGSGEKQIELDKRLIRKQIASYQKELAQLVTIRETQRKKRNKHEQKKISLVGYTNSGKSSLLNLFTHKEVFQKDMLFATLDTSVRSIQLKNNQKVLMSDTVGFINQLPHHLVKAFRSTLEEIKEADLILHVVDSSSLHLSKHIETTNEVLEQLGVKDIPVIYVYNKIDKIQETIFVPHDPYVLVSIKNKYNIDELQDLIISLLYKDYEDIELFIPYNKGEDYQYLKYNYKCQEEFLENGIKIKLSISPKDYHRFIEYNQKIQ